ncbi:hypothetical protein MJC1_03747 [Methylocystis sp. MJC1]|nr:hypothetical protein MJC1_03747 [Methylocystis sp. MJC1]
MIPIVSRAVMPALVAGIHAVQQRGIPSKRFRSVPALWPGQARP